MIQLLQFLHVCGDSRARTPYLNCMVEIYRTTTAGFATGDGESPDRREQRRADEAKIIAASDAQIAAGRLVPLEAIQQWADSIGTADELPLPRG